MREDFDAEKDIVLVGAGGHAKVIIEILQTYYPSINIVGITDPDQSKKTVFGMTVLGNDQILVDLYQRGLRKAFITLGMVSNYQLRSKVTEYVKKIGYQFTNIIHGKSILSSHVTIGKGNVILAGVIINTEAKIGDYCIINTGSIIEHECVLKNNVHIAPGAKLSGQVSVGNNCLIGIGATVIEGIKIGDNCIVGAGSVVIDDLPSNSIAVGVPAKIIKKR